MRPAEDGGVPTEAAEPYLVIIPVFNDWESFSLLLDGLDASLRRSGLEVEVMAVDDGSTIPFQTGDFGGRRWESITSLSVLRLGLNVGHQRAIALALAHAKERKRPRGIVVMDGDGEDKPEDVARLILEPQTGGPRIVFAQRTTRSESLPFRALYFLFKVAHRVLTGSTISFGNFSFIPGALLGRLILVSELWNHYPASVIKARLPYTAIPAHRGKRLAGKSKMDFTRLVTHGLSAISVHGDILGVRALVFTSSLIVLSTLMLLIVVLIRTLTDWAIPGWASYLTASLFIVLLQSVMMSVFFVLLVLSSRKVTDVILRRDYRYFVLEELKVYARNASERVSGLGARAVPEGA